MTFICNSRERDADGIVLEITATRNRATSEHSHSKNIWSRWHELNAPSWFVLESPRARSTLSVVYFPFLIVARKVKRLESQAGEPGKAEVWTRLGRSFCRHVAERKTHFLSPGSQQDDMGGPCAISELVSRRLWCIRICLVNIYLFFRWRNDVSHSFLRARTALHCVSKLANKTKVRSLLCKSNC